MKRSALLFAGILALLVAPLVARGPAAPQTTTAAMTNQDVIKMVGAGLAEDVIINAIRQAGQESFDFTPAGLIEVMPQSIRTWVACGWRNDPAQVRRRPVS